MTYCVKDIGAVDSTNTWVGRNFCGLEDNTVVYSLAQESGRGRAGRHWLGKPGEMLAFSIVLSRLPPDVFPTWIPLLAGVSVVRQVRELGAKKACLKWPNDVLVGGFKLAGILVETLPDSRLVVGVGINLSFTNVSAPHPQAVSLAQLGIGSLNLPEEIMVPIAKNLRLDIERGEGKPQWEIHRSWKNRVLPYLSTLGVEVEWQGPLGEKFSGVAVSLAQDGALSINGRAGSPDVELRAGDVFHVQRS